MSERIIDPERLPNDIQTIRPQYLNEYIGQGNIKKRLGLAIKASKIRKEALDHVLLVGPPGLGKTTLAHIISNELGTNIHVTSGPILEKQGDVAAILTNLEHGDVLFIDEIHRMNRSVEEILYTAMEDFQIDILIGKGPSARSIRIDLQPFTLVGATTRSGLLSAPLRNRFGLIMELDFYSIDELSKIIERAAIVLNVEIEKDAAILLAKRSRGTPRIALRLLRRVRDMSTIRGKVKIDIYMVEEIMFLLGIDKEGLDELDRKILRTIIEVYNGGPVGVKSLAASVGISEDSISEVYEPYLLQSGFIARTHRGRIATKKAYNHLGIKVQRGLFDEE
ncbi:ATP-dependent DNA helicase RuvB [Thermosipho melanesiensis]|uniref:Holliday junction branch migration complex subunit RuvB n=1 Tax=Thermosipho melanesiensis TaxID=46541 RepID=A0ABM6GFK5_9BACT|nr:ATP-dependent DNA helicase RuvB [Thermosipho melanesiensis]OOC36405.1 ATP-dependent DNA helicase RuvB [Thermosipho melanesiensis]OOC37223.1 ATP-dependent DNA helicase RuvB [Thermosipho melanesiensis]OOC37975.1 ATP-dependent DNA helicase RuvB [Thermosipho melanesiensis]OOC41203.1 ATP-dependent DNA helicase RuvB [Thermosipho melanesiensis]